MGNVNMEAYQIHTTDKDAPTVQKALDALKSSESQTSEAVEVKADRIDIAPIFSTESAYSSGVLVYHNKRLYKFITDHTAGAWNSEEVVAINIDTAIRESGGSGGGLPDYSTTEHLAGQKWIDGKDIYEITYPLIVGGVAQYTRGGMENKSYLVGLTGFDLAYISDFIGVRNTAIDSFPIANTMYYTFDKANGAIFIAHDTFTYTDLYVTVRYTKSE